jgi:hypothetical protein
VDDRFDLVLRQREATEAELERRTLAHRRRVARLRSGTELRLAARGGKGKKAAAAATRPLDFLALGDSWFEYPLDGNTPSVNTAIIPQLAQIGSPPPVILNHGLHGQATTAVLKYENQERIISAVTDPSQWVNRKPDAILVSMGGDDICGDQFAIYLDYMGSGLNASRFQGALDSVEASYRDLFALRDAVARGTPIFAHCYDYAIPNGVATFCAGPWLQPSLEFSGYDLAAGLKIVSTMIDGFAARLQRLASEKNNNFVLVDTRKTLQRVWGPPMGWANELHPYPPGFMALAEKFLAALRKHFPKGAI